MDSVADSSKISRKTCILFVILFVGKHIVFCPTVMQGVVQVSESSYIPFVTAEVILIFQL